MDYILSRDNGKHETGSHPENKGRLSRFTGLPVFTGPVDGELVFLVHEKNYADKIRCLSESGGGQLDGDTIVSPGTYEAALAAVTVTVEAAKNGDFAVVRPPGHHAFPDRGSGFCIFNNMAIAAEYLARQGKRVFIIDIDGHLGDATEKFFYHRKDVFYASIHQEGSFPGGGRFSDIGYGDGTGYTLNLPIPPGSGDDIFIKGLERIFAVSDQFAPDIIGISAGFDGHKSDKLLNLNLSANVFFVCGEMLNKRCKPVFTVLEGGYNPEAVRNCADNLISGINGTEIAHPETATETILIELESFESALDEQKGVLGKYWKL